MLGIGPHSSYVFVTRRVSANEMHWPRSHADRELDQFLGFSPNPFLSLFSRNAVILPLNLEVPLQLAVRVQRRRKIEWIRLWQVGYEQS